MLKDINLNLLKKFKVCADSCDFLSAAQKLSTSSGSLSNQITQLEESMGTKLFEKKGSKKTTKLTKNGKQIYELYSVLNEKIDNIDKSPFTEKTIIRVCTTIGLSNYIFSKCLDIILNQYDESLIEVHISQEQDKVIGDEILIRSNILFDESIHTEILLKLNFKLYASKNYIEKYGTPKEINDLKNHYILSTGHFFHYDNFEESPFPLKIISKNQQPHNFYPCS